MAGPSIGFVLGVGALIIGSIDAAVGTGNSRILDKEPVLIGLGSGLLVAGAAAVGYSGFKISRNFRKREEVCP
ncbi:MAG: hypothetical protein AAGF92_10795 [Myxococcota bacterium]